MSLIDQSTLILSDLNNNTVIDRITKMDSTKQSISRFSAIIDESTLTEEKQVLRQLPQKYARNHEFSVVTLENVLICGRCYKNTEPKKFGFKCRKCDMIIHNRKCKIQLMRPCCPVHQFPLRGKISDYVAEHEKLQVPLFIRMIVNEIEMRGLIKHEIRGVLTYEPGLYECTGVDAFGKQVGEIKESLAKFKQVPDLSKISDVHVLCGFLKLFLNSLTEHLTTFAKWAWFSSTCGKNKIQNDI